MPESTYSKALRRAADLVGGVDELRARIKASGEELAQWLAGEVVPPYRVFREVVDLISATSQELRTRRTMRILIVDDERDTVMTLGILLRSEGYDVHLAQAGTEVSGAVRSLRPHAVLLDIGMTDRNGYAVAQELTREHGASCPYLVAVTARSGDADRKAAFDSGFRHHVAKPYDPDQLLALLASLNRAAA
jgi:two-component system CheB/CheR fusion protein